MDKQYIVTVHFPEGILAEHRIRSGIVVRRDIGYAGPLSDDQLKAITDDPYLTVEEAVVESAPKTKVIPKSTK